MGHMAIKTHGSYKASITYKYPQGKTSVNLKNFGYLNTHFAFPYTPKFNTNSHVRSKTREKTPDLILQVTLVHRNSRDTLNRHEGTKV